MDMPHNPIYSRFILGFTLIFVFQGILHKEIKKDKRLVKSTSRLSLLYVILIVKTIVIKSFNFEKAPLNGTL